MHTIIHTPTPDLEKSLDFYTTLDFKIVEEGEANLLTDGKFLIEINADRYARAGIKLFSKDWGLAVDQLRNLTAVIERPFGYVCDDPSGVRIYLMNGLADFRFNPSDKPFSVLGNFAGISLETTDVQRSFEFWAHLGFKKNSGTPDAGWMALENDDGMIVSLMKPFTAPHLFFNPSLTFFNGKDGNPKVIQRIRDLQIPITEEITVFNDAGIVDNVILRDPGGYGFFVFND